MATSAGSDVIPVRKTTKERLRAVKGDQTYDEVLRVLLDAFPPARLRALLASRRAHVDEAVLARRAARLRAASAPRSDDKQVLISRVAGARWEQWLRDGRVVSRGTRLFDWNTRERTKVGISVEWESGRGLAPPESPNDRR